MLANLSRRHAEERSTSALSWPDYLRLYEQFGFNGTQYIVPSGNTAELTALQAQRDPIVGACITARLLVFSEIRFAFQNWQAGRPGTLFGTQDLSLFEKPWPNATTGDLLARCELDASLYGNSYWVPKMGQLIRLNPTQVTIVTGDVDDDITGLPFGKTLLGYLVSDAKGQHVATFLPNEIAHYHPLPDPQHGFRGQTWLSTLLPDVIADMDMSDYKHSFLYNAATPSLVVTFDSQVKKEAFNDLRDKMEAAHTGPMNAFKTLYLGGGADVKVVGSNFDQLSIETVQSAGETRIAAAAGVPAAIVGIAEGLKGSSLNSGNYQATRRRFSDGTMRPLWRSVAGAFSSVITVPGGSRLWYDDRDVMFLQEDVTDAADIRAKDAQTILTLVNSGYEPDTVVAAVQTGDFTLLKHTGLVSVQLQPPGAAIPPDAPALPAA